MYLYFLPFPPIFGLGTMFSSRSLQTSADVLICFTLTAERQFSNPDARHYKARPCNLS